MQKKPAPPTPPAARPCKGNRPDFVDAIVLLASLSQWRDAVTLLRNSTLSSDSLPVLAKALLPAPVAFRRELKTRFPRAAAGGLGAVGIEPVFFAEPSAFESDGKLLRHGAVSNACDSIRLAWGRPASEAFAKALLLDCLREGDHAAMNHCLSLISNPRPLAGTDVFELCLASMANQDSEPHLCLSMFMRTAHCDTGKVFDTAFLAGLPLDPALLSAIEADIGYPGQRARAMFDDGLLSQGLQSEQAPARPGPAV